MTADVKVVKVESKMSVTNGATSTMLKERWIRRVGFEQGGGESKHPFGKLFLPFYSQQTWIPCQLGFNI